MNLYQINTAIENFEPEVDELTGEVTNLDELNQLKMSEHEKRENIALWCKQMKADESSIDAEIKALQARKKALKSKHEWFENYLGANLNGKKFETPKVAVSFRKSTSVQTDDQFIEFCGEHGYDQFVTKKVEINPNKRSIKEQLKADPEFFEGHAFIKEDKKMQIK